MAALSTGAIVVFALVVVALVLFVMELLPPDVTAIAVPSPGRPGTVHRRSSERRDAGFARVGLSLQALLLVVTTLAVATDWPL